MAVTYSSEPEAPTQDAPADGSPAPRGRHRAPRTVSARAAEARAIAVGQRPTGRHRRDPESR